MNATLLFLGGVGFQEILLIGLFVLVFFGAKKIPEFMKGLGKGVKEFKSAVKDVKNEVEETTSSAKIEEGKQVLKTYASLRAIQTDLQRGTLTCYDLVQYHLTKIREKKHLNAFLSVYEDEALAQAAQIDQKIKEKKAEKYVK